MISQFLSYIGYPRSLNALRCVNETAKSPEGEEDEKSGHLEKQAWKYFPNWAVWTFVKAILGTGSGGPAAR